MQGFVNVYFNSGDKNQPTAIAKSKPTTIVKRIAKVKYVQFVYLVTGSVDAIAFIDTPDSGAFRDTIMTIYNIGGVDHTSTNVAL